MHQFKKLIFIVILCFVTGNLQSDSGRSLLENMDFYCSVSSLNCGICGLNGVLPKSRISGWASIGLLHLRTLEVYDTQVRLSADSKSEFDSQYSVLHGYCNFGAESGIAYGTAYGTAYGYAHINSMPNRGIATVDITYGIEDEIDFAFLEERLCQECIGKILAEYQKAGSGKCRNVFLVDFQTMEFYALSESITAFMINNYYFHIDHADGLDRILIVYAPKRH